MKTHLIFVILIPLVLFLNSCSEQPSETEEKSIWEKVSDAPGSINFVQVENNKIYATCFAAGSDIFISSTDLGKTWQTINLGTSIYENGFLYLKENHGFISCWDGLYRSDDYGLTWARDTILVNYLSIYVGYPVDVLTLNAISLRGNNIYLGQLVAGNWDGHIKGVIASTDNGNSWQCPTSATPYGIWELICTESNIVISNLGKIYYSPDNCETWIEASGEFDYQDQIRKLLKIDSKIFAVSSKRIYFSENEGQFWYDCSNGLPLTIPPYLERETFTRSEDYLFILRSDGVIYYTHKDNIDWKIFNSELPKKYHWNLFVVDNYLYYSSSNKLWRTKIPD